MDVKNVYAPRTARIISLLELMDKEIGSRLIHYLSIDTEGYEYIILNSLVGNGTFAKSGIEFCQIDAELHNPSYKYTHVDVKKLNSTEFQLNFLQESSPYLPVFRLPYGVQQKITFINVANPECEKAFNFSKYFKK